MEVLGRRRSAVGRGVKLQAEETVQRLTMYRNAPAHEMSLDEFEMCAIDRLQGSSCHTRATRSPARLPLPRASGHGLYALSPPGVCSRRRPSLPPVALLPRPTSSLPCISLKGLS